MTNQELAQILACPRCKSEIDFTGDFVCQHPECGLHFPLVRDVPVIINEPNSLFQIEDFVELRETTYRPSSSLKKKLKSVVPDINLNIKSQSNFKKFFARLLKEHKKPRVLVIGGAVAGQGLDLGNLSDDITVIESDVAFAARTNFICDAHDLPFKDETFDGVIAQAVLEHVLDPWRCAAEIHRVLKRKGTVYAETPFMQQVHAGRYDFTRFTHLGHRRLFRAFEEIESGATCGAGMALAWSYCYFLKSFFRNQTLQQIAFAFGSLTSFWLKYFDYFLINMPNAFDAASSYYFWGRKSDTILSDDKLISEYKGAIQ